MYTYSGKVIFMEKTNTGNNFITATFEKDSITMIIESIDGYEKIGKHVLSCQLIMDNSKENMV